jgi:hypothetical protein
MSARARAFLDSDMTQSRGSLRVKYFAAGSSGAPGSGAASRARSLGLMPKAPAHARIWLASAGLSAAGVSRTCASMRKSAAQTLRDRFCPQPHAEFGSRFHATRLSPTAASRPAGRQAALQAMTATASHGGLACTCLQLRAARLACEASPFLAPSMGCGAVTARRYGSLLPRNFILTFCACLSAPGH